MIPVLLLVFLFLLILSVPELRDAQPVSRHKRQPED
jgi:hypothetical protein